MSNSKFVTAYMAIKNPLWSTSQVEDLTTAAHVAEAMGLSYKEVLIECRKAVNDNSMSRNAAAVQAGVDQHQGDIQRTLRAVKYKVGVGMGELVKDLLAKANNQNTEITTKNQEIADQAAQITTKNQEIANQAAQIADKDAQIADKDKKIRTLIDISDALENALTVSVEAIKRARKEKQNESDDV